MCVKLLTLFASGAAHGCASGGLLRAGTRLDARDRAGNSLLWGKRHLIFVMPDHQRGAAQQIIGHFLPRYLDAQAALAEGQAEGQPRNALWQPGSKGERVLAGTHPAEARDQRVPCARERSDVEAIARIMFQVMEVHQRGLPEIVICKIELADLGG